jgi:hypothetical protein
MLFYFACEAAGASSARHSLRPLLVEDVMSIARLEQNMLRDREAVPANDSATQRKTALRTRSPNAEDVGWPIRPDLGMLRFATGNERRKTARSFGGILAGSPL